VNTATTSQKVPVAAASEKLSFIEKAGYSGGDAATNFVFITMIYFQTNFYTDVFGLSATAAAAILLYPRLWDAIVDPIVGILADRTDTRWGKFRPWVLFTAIPWCVVMVLAYTTPKGWSMGSMIAYAVITNTVLMTIYSMNNMPYAALGGVMTGDVNERVSLNSFRFVAVNAAQFLVVGFTLPLRDKFAGPQHNLQHGWEVVMTIWAAICLVLFIITFATTRERIKPPVKEKSSPALDFRDLFQNNPWKIMWCWTLVHFAILSFRGAALYNYFFHYADKAAMYNWLGHFGLVAPPLAAGQAPTGFLDKWLGYIVHGDPSNLANSNVASVFFSVTFMLGIATTIVVILISAPLAKKFGKKTVCAVGFALATIGWVAFYFLSPTNVWGMIALGEFTSIVYAPSIPLTWAIFADTADYSEWKTGRRFTGIVFATIMFALKAGLALGSAAFLMVMKWFFEYDTKLPDAPSAVQGYRVCGSLLTGVLFAICTVLLFSYPLNKRMTIQMADELNERRSKLAAA